jgi:signal transduction histidine kinase
LTELAQLLSAASLAHKFNNLLTSILGYTTLAQAELSIATPAQYYLEPILETVQRATHLCDQLLAYAGKGRFCVEKLELNSVVEDAAPALRNAVGAGSNLRFQLAKDLPDVDVDKAITRAWLVHGTNRRSRLQDRGVGREIRYIRGDTPLPFRASLLQAGRNKVY